MSGSAGQSGNALLPTYNSPSQVGYGSSHPTSPISEAPPPPPPKPVHSTDPSRTGTPLVSSTPFQHQQTGPPPPIPPHPPLTHHSLPNPPPPNPQYTQPQPQLPPHPQQQQQQHQHHHDRQQQQLNQQQQQQTQQHNQPQTNPPPTLQDHWLPPTIPSKSISDLQQILSSPSLLTALAQTHPSYESSLQPLQSQLATNLALAGQVSGHEAQLRQLRDQTAQLLLNHTSLQTQWRRKQSEMDDALSPWGPRSMYQRLVSSVGEQEALLKALYDSFLEGSSDQDNYYGGAGGKASEKEVAEWVRRIKEGTTTLEKRREMRARWDEGRVGGWR